MINTIISLHIGCPPEDSNHNIFDQFDMEPGENIYELLYSVDDVTWAKLSIHVYSAPTEGGVAIDKEIILAYFRRNKDDVWVVSEK